MHSWSGLYLCRPAVDAVHPLRIRQGPSSLYTFPGRRGEQHEQPDRPGLSSVLQPPQRAAVPPTLTPFTPAVSEPGAQTTFSSPLRLPISPPRHGLQLNSTESGSRGAADGRAILLCGRTRADTPLAGRRGFQSAYTDNARLGAAWIATRIRTNPWYRRTHCSRQGQPAG